jgi:hypothetical protein
MPRTDRQSPRLGVSLRVIRWSSSPIQSRSSSPTGASDGNSMMPAASWASPSSLAEHSMPKDSTPRTLACLISNSGSLAPTRAQAVLRPARALGAPQTMVSGPPSPVLTWQTWRRSALGCFSALRISATTTREKAGAAGSRASTSRPAMVSRWPSRSLERSGLTRLLSQASENCMVAFPGPIQANCLRNRRSFSKNRRRSSTP